MLQFKKSVSSLLAAAALSALSAHASAGVTYYTSQSDYAAALASSTTETFDSTPLASGLSFVSNAGSVGGGLFNDRVVIGSATTTFSFGGDVNGFGGFFDESPGGWGQGLAFTLTLANGSTEVLSQHLDQDGGSFFGFISTDAFSSVKLTGGNESNGVAETYNVDNVQFGSLSTVPENGSMAMLLAGLGMLGVVARRRAGK
ncbi:MAG TPA: PEP-CTERM sorting domain-containing protein [Burkholderiaceae bacterium]